MAPRLRSRWTLIAIGVIAFGAIGGGTYFATTATGPAARLAIEPGAALLAAPGETRELKAVTLDASGRATGGGEVTWSSNHPDVVSVDSTGTITGKVVGSAQITAEVAGIEASPILVVVAEPAPGVKLVTDEQVVVDIAPVDPNAEPSFENQFTATLKRDDVQVGDRLIGNGGRAIAGEVVAVATNPNGTVVTLQLIPLRELLPNLKIDEQFDLSTAEVEIPDDIERLYDITRAGASLTFTPKPNFNALVGAGVAPASSRVLGLHDGALVASAGQAVGTYTTELGPFECEFDSSTLPVQLSGAPAVSIDLNPILDLDWSNGELRRFIVGGEVKGTAAGGFKVTAAFEGKLTCARDFYSIRLPIGGPLSLFVGGTAPIGAAFEIAGKVTVSTLELGTKLEASAALELGLDCPTTCAFQGKTTGTAAVTPTIDGPSLRDLRLEPSFTASATVKIEVGNPFWAALRLKFVEAKFGAKLAASWAPTKVQILDPSYKSDFKLTLEAGAALNSDTLGDIATLFGLPSITFAELKSSIDLARSPVGTLTTTKARYEAGETVTAKVAMDEEWLDFLTMYDVTRLQIVHYAAGVETAVGNQAATAGQKDFEITFAAPSSIAASELYAFVTTKVPPLDLFALELDRKLTGNGVVFASDRNAVDRPYTDIWTANGDGTALRQLTVDPGHEWWPTWSPDGTRIAYGRAGSIWTMKADGTDKRQLARLNAPGLNHFAWSPDGQQLAFSDWKPDDQILHLWVVAADGSGRRRAATTGVYSVAWPTWSPDGTRIVFGGQDPATGVYRIYAVPPAGGAATLLAQDGSAPAYSPDGKKIAYMNGKRQLTIMNADGTGSTLLPIFGSSRVAWSPDGTRLIVDGGAQDYEIFSFNLDGSGVQTYEDGPGNDWMADW